MKLDRAKGIRLAQAVLFNGLLLNGSGAFAHDLWVTTDAKDGKRVAAINFGDVDKREIADRSKIVDFDLITASGKTDLRPGVAPANRLGAPVLQSLPTVMPTGSVIAVSYDNGFWLTRPGDKKETNTSPLMDPKGLDAHWTVKFGKFLLGPGSYTTSTKARGEFTVLKDPFKLAKGEKLPVRLLINGKPVAGTRVRYCDGLEPLAADKVPFVKTDKDGLAEIPLDRKGPYQITTDPTVDPTHAPLSSGDHVFVALSFDLAQ